ncbi:hypothetical protein Tco_1556294 [Tanacetum coccineum]
MSNHNRIYVIPSHTKKIFANMRRQGKDFSGRVTSLFPTKVDQAQEEMGEGSEMVTDPHHTPIITQPLSSQPQKEQKSRRPKRKDTEVPQPSDPTNVADEAVTEEPTQEITILKLRVKRLKKKGGSRTHKLKRLYKVGRTTRVNSSDEASLGDQEDASKQGRKIADTDKDAEITLVDETQGRYGDEDMFGVHDLDGDEVVVESEVAAKKKDDEVSVVKEEVSVAEETVNTATITEDEITLAQALAELKSVKPKVTTATTKTTTTTKGILLQEPNESITTTTTIPSKDNGKGIMVEESLKMKKKDQISFDEQEALKLQTEFDEEDRLAREKAQQVEEANIAWDDIQAKIDADYQLAKRLQAQEQQELTIEKKSTLFQQLLEKRRKFFAVKRAEEKRNRPPTRAQQRSIMCTYLKNMAGWKPKDLKNKSFTNIQDLFDKVMNRVNTFVDMDTELVEGSETREESSSKRAGDELKQESTKNQKMDVDKEEVELKQQQKSSVENLQGNKVLQYKPYFSSAAKCTSRKSYTDALNTTQLKLYAARGLYASTYIVRFAKSHVFKFVWLLPKAPKASVRIKRLLDDLRVTAAQLMLLVYKLLLLVFRVNAADT